MFLLFDILALNGKTNLGMYNLRDRLGIIGHKVVDVFRDHLAKTNMDPARLPFFIAGKISFVICRNLI